MRSLLSVSATTNLDKVEGKGTSKCLSSSLWGYPSGDFDRWFPVNQPDADACVISTLVAHENWRIFAGTAVAILGIDAGTSTQMLGKALIENGHTMTLAQADEMVEKTESGDNTDMRTNGYGNFFFVETGDENDPVSVGCVFRDERVWRANIRGLGRGNRWNAVDRLLVRNLEATKL